MCLTPAKRRAPHSPIPAFTAPEKRARASFAKDLRPLRSGGGGTNTTFVPATDLHCIPVGRRKYCFVMQRAGRVAEGRSGSKPRYSHTPARQVSRYEPLRRIAFTPMLLPQHALLGAARRDPVSGQEETRFLRSARISASGSAGDLPVSDFEDLFRTHRVPFLTNP
jgi:hypothetical protein